MVLVWCTNVHIMLAWIMSGIPEKLLETSANMAWTLQML
jgi:hypothetical protein